jgi:hypothetical protein
MYSIKSDLKKNLKQNYTTILIQCFSNLIIASMLIVAIPLSFRTNSNKDKIINSLSFFTCSFCCLIAYIKSNSLIEIGGKVAMLNQLEKESFIKENLITQERYLTAVSDSLIPINIDTEIHHQNTSQIIDVSHHNQHNPIIETITENCDVTVCPHCESTNINKNGTIEGKQRYKCKDCKKTF